MAIVCLRCGTTWEIPADEPDDEDEVIIEIAPVYPGGMGYICRDCMTPEEAKIRPYVIEIEEGEDLPSALRRLQEKQAAGGGF